MSDQMHPLPFDVLLDWILREYRHSGSIFGIPESQFYRPDRDPACATDLYGSHLTTPIGPAAGPHTQLAQNIVAAWLCGGRFIELKTVQVMDELDIPRPCIDLADEGYNVEWSQELHLGQSVSEYTKAWALLFVLRRLLEFEDATPFGTIFNMSVGYNLEGILSDPMQAFMRKLEDASEELDAIRERLSRFPEFAGIEFPDRLTNSVTLSTMHGCPPDEIEKIARYLLEERSLHTTVKLNPTLLGKEDVLRILHERLGFEEIEIPDAVFDHDLRYDRALALIRSLKVLAAEKGLTFAVKLSNTLAMANHRGILPGDEMYMSGRALYPVTVTLLDRLREAFDGDLAVSYSAGADALNVAGLLAAGAKPITVASDLLKPGGYGRLRQFVESIEAEMAAAGANDLVTFTGDRDARLKEIAGEAVTSERYAKAFFPHGLPKVETELAPFDCIEAPCSAACAVHQDVAEYARWIAAGEPDRALATILSRNPLPGVTGHVCTNLCQTKCTRNNYDQPVAIRKLKRYAAERGRVQLSSAAPTGRTAAVIGSGPSGLAAAFHLALSGVAVTVFEAKARPGGMLAIAPTFRLPREVVEADIDRIRGLGVTIEVNAPVTGPPEDLLAEGFDAVYVACGYTRDAKLGIEGIDADGVHGALDFLDRVAIGAPPELGRVVVIGGGNTAMDAARTAQRLTGAPSTVLYRRSRNEMPAEVEEIEDLLAEGNRLVELASPSRFLTEEGKVSGVACLRNELGDPDDDGRRRPVPIPGSEFIVEAETVVLATGQRPDLGFLEGGAVGRRDDGPIVVDEETGRAADGVFAGGDVVRGPEIIIAACADGRRAAASICSSLDVPFATVPWNRPTLDDAQLAETKRARARKSMQRPTAELPVERRSGFGLVEQTYTEGEARAEAARCLQCAAVCDKCVEVCPNRANVALVVHPVDTVIPVVDVRGDQAEATGEERVTISQPRQILHVDELCNECGNCATFCVHEGDPYRDKPRLFLRRAAFDAAEENAWFVTPEGLHRRERGFVATLTRSDGGFDYTSSGVRARLSSDGTVETLTVEPASGGSDPSVSLRPAIEMLLLFRGIEESAPHVIEASVGLSGRTG